MTGISVCSNARANQVIKWSSVSGIFALLLALLLLSTSTLAQTGTSSIAGTVTDQQGRAVVGAEVTLTHLANQRAAHHRKQPLLAPMFSILLLQPITALK